MIVIIGSGLAGYHMAKALRAIDQQIAITMITTDDGHFYAKPQLSVALGQQKTAEDLMRMDAEHMRQELAITILTQTEVTHIDPKQKMISYQQTDGNKHILNYQDLVLALGAETPTPPVSGNATDQIMHLNTVYEYQHFRQQLQANSHVTVIGAGLVGCEFANDLSQADYGVSCIDPASRPLSLLVPEIISTELKQNMAEHGVNWQLGRTVQVIDQNSKNTAINHSSNKPELLITLDNGEQFNTNYVLSAIGLKPRVQLAQQIGIETNKGICVNNYLATNIDHIYAIGDCAEITGWVMPYIAPIKQATAALAKTLTGEPSTMEFPPMPVNIKTTVYPIAICRPPNAPADSQWEFNQDPETQALRGKLIEPNTQAVIGFALTKEATRDRMALASELAHWA